MATFLDTNVAVYVHDHGAEDRQQRAAVRGGCDRLLTEDLNDDQEIRGVRIENPFKAQESPDSNGAGSGSVSD